MAWRRHFREEPAADDRASGRAGGAGRQAWPSSRGRVGGLYIFMAILLQERCQMKEKEMRRRRWGRGNTPFLLFLPRWRSAAAFGRWDKYNKKVQAMERKPRAIDGKFGAIHRSASDNDAVYHAREDMECILYTHPCTL